MERIKGILVAIGGGEDRGIKDENDLEAHELSFSELGILKNIVSLTGKECPSVEVITTASSIPEDYFHQYYLAFQKLGCTSINHIDINSREKAINPIWSERIASCDLVMITGGDQLRLCTILENSPLIKILKQRYREDAIVIAGTSAGAAALCNIMICGGKPTEAYFKGAVRLGQGFGFLDRIIIDTHFDKRGRFGRLIQAIASQPGSIGIGLGEDTGIIIENGSIFKAVGSSSVIILDSSKVDHNNIGIIKERMPLSVSNLTLHVLSHNDIFNIGNRTFKGVHFKPHIQ